MKKTTCYLIALIAVAIINTTLGGMANLIIMIIICMALLRVACRMDKEAKRKIENK